MSESSIPEIERTAVDHEALRSFSSERQYRELAFNLLREAASYLCVIGSISFPLPGWNRNQAIVGGMIVRLFKLACAVLDQMNEQRQELISAYSRQIFETTVNVAYYAQNQSDELAESYLRHSLKRERRLRDEILRNIAERDGEQLPIEGRMLKSIARTERMTGIALDSVDLKDKAPWGGKNTRQKSTAVGLERAYDPAFGGFSRNVHGAWHDLYEYHLKAVEDDANGTVRFEPNMGWKRVRPQIIFTLAWLNVQACRHALAPLGGAEALDLFAAKLDDLEERIRDADEAHESYLSSKTWPET